MKKTIFLACAIACCLVFLGTAWSQTPAPAAPSPEASAEPAAAPAAPDDAPAATLESVAADLHARSVEMDSVLSRPHAPAHKFAGIFGVIFLANCAANKGQFARNGIIIHKESSQFCVNSASRQPSRILVLTSTPFLHTLATRSSELSRGKAIRGTFCVRGAGRTAGLCVHILCISLLPWSENPRRGES